MQRDVSLESGIARPDRLTRIENCRTRRTDLLLLLLNFAERMIVFEMG